MTVANIQNLSIRRGPLQKLLGIADLEVHTAGGGKSASSHEPGKASTNLHVGRFRGIENAPALRDRIEASLRRHRDGGLGDPDEAHHDGTEAGSAASGPSPLLLAAEELRREAGALRAAAESFARS
jgi:hypothetical protein